MGFGPTFFCFDSVGTRGTHDQQPPMANLGLDSDGGRRYRFWNLAPPCRLPCDWLSLGCCFLWRGQQFVVWFLAPVNAPSGVTSPLTSTWQRLLLSVVCLLGAAVCAVGIYLWRLWPEQWQAGLVFVLFGLLVLAPVTIKEIQSRRRPLGNPQLQNSRVLRSAHCLPTGFRAVAVLTDTRSSEPDYMSRWNSGYNQQECVLSIDFMNASDSAVNAAIWKQALDACVTEARRTNLRQRIARSKF